MKPVCSRCLKTDLRWVSWLVGDDFRKFVSIRYANFAVGEERQHGDKNKQQIHPHEEFLLGVGTTAGDVGPALDRAQFALAFPLPCFGPPVAGGVSRRLIGDKPFG